MYELYDNRIECPAALHSQAIEGMQMHKILEAGVVWFGDSQDAQRLVSPQDGRANFWTNLGCKFGNNGLIETKVTIFKA
jgi:hypothetical protein